MKCICGTIESGDSRSRATKAKVLGGGGEHQKDQTFAHFCVNFCTLLQELLRREGAKAQKSTQKRAKVQGF
jgi:hypothetical protein